jgi:hypothetical protein
VTTRDPNDFEYTRRIDLSSEEHEGDLAPAPAASVYTPQSVAEPYAEPAPASYAPPAPAAQPSAPVPDPSPAPARREIEDVEQILYVPLAVTIGDGFKFGCGFFLASVIATLVAFVLLAALFVLVSLTGINLPVGR